MIKLIAETAWHHEGDFDFMKRLVETITRESKADIVKFHLTLDPHQYMAEDFPAYHKVHKLLFSENQWNELIEMVFKAEKKLMFLVNDNEAARFALQYKPDLIEIHSVAITDYHLLKYLHDRQENFDKLVLGVGGTNIYDIEKIINYWEFKGVLLMFGFQNYPTLYENVNLKRINRIKKIFPDFSFGYADHTAWDEPNNELISLVGAAQEMDYLEKHITTRYGEKRTDYEAAISVDMFNRIHEKLQVINACMGDGLLELSEAEKKYASVGPMRRAPFLSTNVKAGEVFSPEKVSFKRTQLKSEFNGFEVYDEYSKLVFTKDIKKDEILKKEHLKTKEK